MVSVISMIASGGNTANCMVVGVVLMVFSWWMNEGQPVRLPARG